MNPASALLPFNVPVLAAITGPFAKRRLSVPSPPVGSVARQRAPQGCAIAQRRKVTTPRGETRL